MKRRQFLGSSAVVLGAGLLAPKVKAEKSNSATIKKYRPLGKTGLHMSDISFGAGDLSSSSMILRAIDRGINYFDTAPDYGSSQYLIGKAMKRIQRDKIILTSKFCDSENYSGHLPLGASKKDFIQSVEASLKELNTDYIDICFVHAIGSQSRSFDEEKQRLLAEEMLSAVTTLKQSGKIRFLAASSHGPHNVEKLMITAAESGHFDVIMPAFNFLKFPKVPEVIKIAKKNGVGVVAMKTLAGAREIDFDSKGDDFAQAAFKWVLNHKEVDGLVVTIRTIGDLNRFLPASGVAFDSKDQLHLNRYAQKYGREICRTGCGDCESSCNENVEIASILRHQMYFQDYREPIKAIKGYQSLQNNATSCLDCSDESCKIACPHGIDVSGMLRKAHEGFSSFLV